MKTQYLVLTLENTEIVTNVSFTSDVLHVEYEYALISILEASFETELGALKRVEELLETEEYLEVEIKKVFVK